MPRYPDPGHSRGRGASRPVLSGLPDPQSQSAFYAGVPGLRLVAFLIDSAVIGLAVLLILPFTAFLALFFLPLLILGVSFVYRSVTVASGSATWGMRLVGIELRNHRGERLDPGTALAHTFLYLLCFSMVVPMLVSAGAMLMSARGQGLHDLLLGTTAIRRPG